ncbi:MAG: glucuronate isomerase, partial [Bacteroidota bacterium]|nr:glucuronate isomerase [Bacteroidota bacterium]
GVKTVSKTIGNPLFHWSCLELKRIFGIDEILSEKNADEVWNTCNKQLQNDGFGALDILHKWKAEIVCTSDDLTDNLELHKTASGNGGVKVLPSLRGDSIVAFDGPSSNWMQKLSGNDGAIKNLDDYKQAITQKLNDFNEAGCKLADHSLDAGFAFLLPTESVATILFENYLNDIPLNNREIVLLKSHLLVFLGTEYCKRGWVLQLHIGAHRYTSTRLRKLVGPAGGYATIGKTCDIESLCMFLDAMEQQELLPRTILYTLNPADNAAFATLTGSYAEDGVAGKIQFGPAWWYNDQYEGIRQHLVTLSSYGLLSHFVGMTTDSRSLLSFSRHEYFRRILCNVVGMWVDGGELPADNDLISQLIKDIAYNNSKKFIFNK